MKKSFLLILLCAFFVIGMSLTGCGKSSDNTGDSGGVSKDEYQTYRVTLFFANEEFIATGDDSLEKFMVYEREMESRPAEAYRDALELLKTSPEEGYSTVLNDSIRFNQVYLDGDTVYVDLAGSGLNGGSLDETFLISQIVDTLLNTFDEVKQVQFLIDGEAAETLMGHVDTANPFTKDLFTE